MTPSIVKDQLGVPVATTGTPGLAISVPWVRNIRDLQDLLFIGQPMKPKSIRACFVNSLFDNLSLFLTLHRDHPYVTSAKELGGWGQKNGNFC